MLIVCGMQLVYMEEENYDTTSWPIKKNDTTSWFHVRHFWSSPRIVVLSLSFSLFGKSWLFASLTLVVKYWLLVKMLCCPIVLFPNRKVSWFSNCVIRATMCKPAFSIFAVQSNHVRKGLSLFALLVQCFTLFKFCNNKKNNKKC